MEQQRVAAAGAEPQPSAKKRKPPAPAATAAAAGQQPAQPAQARAACEPSAAAMGAAALRVDEAIELLREELEYGGCRCSSADRRIAGGKGQERALACLPGWMHAAWPACNLTNAPTPALLSGWALEAENAALRRKAEAAERKALAHQRAAALARAQPAGHEGRGGKQQQLPAGGWAGAVGAMDLLLLSPEARDLWFKSKALELQRGASVAASAPAAPAAAAATLQLPAAASRRCKKLKKKKKESAAPAGP